LHTPLSLSKTPQFFYLHDFFTLLCMSSFADLKPLPNCFLAGNVPTWPLGDERWNTWRDAGSLAEPEARSPTKLPAKQRRGGKRRSAAKRLDPNDPNVAKPADSDKRE
jgi:hypothetical protein